jgi:hypothetical protein
MRIVDLFGRIIRAFITMFIECIPALSLAFSAIFALTPSFVPFMDKVGFGIVPTNVDSYVIVMRSLVLFGLLYWAMAYFVGIGLRNITRWLWGKI